ncbi:MAG TPA: ribosome-associated translation inhibitor RaiA [Chitinophagales bacterium]|nr:ribosome-associated translation inhibitor RaiA [Bacteroidota bacterium]MCB9074829.1 ribosome-associated translation inhibitor RaiA [Chitinophagales bacterium]HMU97154.1 ribosome-associated translation inhibitor RaiA [Chitinophagales bacterium]
MKVEIQSLHFNADASLVEFINKKMEKLDRFYDKIIGSDVVLSLEQLNTQVKDKVVIIKTQIPGNILIAKETSKKFEEAVDLAVESIKKQMEKFKAKQPN